MKRTCPLPRVLFLAAYTSRSKAYAQALMNAGLEPAQVLLYGEPGKSRPGQGGENAGSGSSYPVFLPDLSMPLEETCRQANWSLEKTSIGDVNDPTLVAQLKAFSPEFILFSGYGGQIVSAEALSVAPFLHVHSGFLPDERGSTTAYYGILKNGRLGVSAIFLQPEIDTGPILNTRQYPVPHNGIHIDHIIDPAIRADLLIRTLSHWASEGEFPLNVQQSPEIGTTYYVIHPVLKHLAILRTPAWRS